MQQGGYHSLHRVMSWLGGRLERSKEVVYQGDERVVYHLLCIFVFFLFVYSYCHRK